MKHKDKEETNLQEGLILSSKKRAELYKNLSDELIDDWFGQSSRLSREDFINQLSRTANQYLTPHAVRQLIRNKIKELNL